VQYISLQFGYNVPRLLINYASYVLVLDSSSMKISLSTLPTEYSAASYVVKDSGAMILSILERNVAKMMTLKDIYRGSK